MELNEWIGKYILLKEILHHTCFWSSAAFCSGKQKVTFEAVCRPSSSTLKQRHQSRGAAFVYLLTTRRRGWLGMVICHHDGWRANGIVSLSVIRSWPSPLFGVTLRTIQHHCRRLGLWRAHELHHLVYMKQLEVWNQWLPRVGTGTLWIISAVIILHSLQQLLFCHK